MKNGRLKLLLLVSVLLGGVLFYGSLSTTGEEQYLIRIIDHENGPTGHIFDWQTSNLDVLQESEGKNVTIVSPANGTVTKEDVITVKWNSSRAGEVDHYELYLNDQPVDTKITRYQTWYDVPLEKAGENTLKLTARFFGGGVTDVIIVLLKDVAPPTVVITNPSDNATLGSTTIELNFTAYDRLSTLSTGPDSPVDAIWITTDWGYNGHSTPPSPNINIPPLPNINFSMTLNSVPLGIHWITVTVKDKAGFYANDTVAFSIQRIATRGPFESALFIGVLGGVIGFAGGALLTWVVRRPPRM